MADRHPQGVVCQERRQTIPERGAQKNPTRENELEQKTNFKLVHECQKENMVTHHDEEFELR